MGTPFKDVYNRFLGKITDDMYMELTPQDTVRDLQNILISILPGFEFPRKDLSQYTVKVSTKPTLEIDDTDFVISTDDETATVKIENSSFNIDLTSEEINILAILMMENWVQRQVTSIEQTRMKYSGSDFKMTSQANHLSKLLNLLAETQRQSIHMQRLYRRRRVADDGSYVSNWSVLRSTNPLSDQTWYDS